MCQREIWGLLLVPVAKAHAGALRDSVPPLSLTYPCTHPPKSFWVPKIDHWLVVFGVSFSFLFQCGPGGPSYKNLGKYDKQHKADKNSVQLKDGNLSVESGEINFLPNKKEEEEEGKAEIRRKGRGKHC